MYSLQLTPEQLEIRDTIREFVTRKVKPVVLKSERLDVADRSLPKELLVQASQIGLRSLALSEQAGGAGADALTTCIVTEELAAGDADFAAILSETSWLSHVIFDIGASDAAKTKLLPKFLSDDNAHLAFAGSEPGSDTRLGVNYHRPASPGLSNTTAVKSGNDLVITGIKDYVANAPIAGLIAVLVNIAGRAGVVLVPADAAGVSVKAHEKPWQHGVCGEVTFKDVRIPSDHQLKDAAVALLTDRAIPLLAAIAVGIGRAAHETAIDYAKLRVQGGRPLIEHQAIGTKLADVAIRLEVSRASVWQAAWASDHPEAVSDRSLTELPLATIAQVFASEAMVKAAKDSAEIFGAMGVMRDMPLQKYIHDARVCQHSGNGNSEAKLRLAELISGYRRADMPLAAE
jgi:alkylation response protein AidB-like acyl-CoA dehydrogenase